MKPIPPLRNATILSLVRAVDPEGLMQKSILQRVGWALDDLEAIDIAQIVLDIAKDEYDDMHEVWAQVAAKITLHKNAVAQAEAVCSADVGIEQSVTVQTSEESSRGAEAVATLTLDPIGLTIDPSVGP